MILGSNMTTTKVVDSSNGKIMGIKRSHSAWTNIVGGGLGPKKHNNYWKNNRCLQGSCHAWTSTMGGGNGSKKQIY